VLDIDALVVWEASWKCRVCMEKAAANWCQPEKGLVRILGTVNTWSRRSGTLASSVAFHWAKAAGRDKEDCWY